jgi:hypothetical protein
VVIGEIIDFTRSQFRIAMLLTVKITFFKVRHYYISKEKFKQETFQLKRENTKNNNL